jgi:penicillin amidase
VGFSRETFVNEYSEYDFGMRRKLIWTLVVVVVLLAAAAGGGYHYLRRSLPSVDGTISLAGASAPAGDIDIIRDADDIPHIFAATKLDAFFGLGYTHAQDRLWQMEFQRRIGNGRLSEIFGAQTLPEDQFLRTVGFARAARSAWEHLPEDARTQVNAYVAGVNAFISTHHGAELPPEFTLLRFEPEPWTGQDVVVWVKMMAWDLSSNYSSELMRMDLAAQVGAKRMADLVPPFPANGLTILGGTSSLVTRSTKSFVTRPFQGRETDAVAQPAVALAKAGRDVAQGREAAETVRDFLEGARIEGIGSNNWVVDGTMTASGKPMLANDPHLATHVPSLWYLAHMTAGDFDVVGATLPGTPAVAIGRNRFIAWGETNVAADVEDLYREHLSADGTTAEFQGQQEPMRVVTETITVKGAAPVTVSVHITRHGPIVSDAINAVSAAATTGPKAPIREPMAFRWTALDDEDASVLAFLHLNEARNWTQFTTALRDFVAPSQNFVYADVDGHIGYYAPGHIPIRANGDGSRPADGAAGNAEWTGWIPFDELPHTFDPPSHFIVTANNPPEPAEYPRFIGLEFPNPYRAQRITGLLRGREKLTPDDFRAIQADTFSLHAQELLPRLLQHAHPIDQADVSAVELLKHWNLDARADSTGAAIFEAWFLRLVPTIAGDDLGDFGTSTYQGRFSFVTRFVESVLDAPTSPWCDDTRTPMRETCDDDVTAALHQAVAQLAKEMGADQGRWRWDAVHRAVFPHQGLDTVPVLHTLLSRSMPNGGDWSTVDVGPVDVDHPFNQISIPGYRQIIDLSPANNSRFLDAVGQSGHFLSPHYDDFLKDWQRVAYRRMRMEKADVENGAIGRLRITPK